MIMKNILNIFFLFLFSFSNAQKNQIIYKVDGVNRLKDNKPRAKALKEELDLMIFTLKFDQSMSSFEKNKTLYKNKHVHGVATILSGGRYSFFQTNGVKKESFIAREIGGRDYHVIKDYMYGWELLNETKKIEGYTAFKAMLKIKNRRTGGFIEYKAWYTPEIPYPYGPIGFGGLPGVILQLRKGNLAIFTAKSLVLNNKNIKVLTPKKGKRISAREYELLLRSRRRVTPD